MQTAKKQKTSLHSSPDPISIPPEPDEVEVSIFGSGFGESIVIHTGTGEWIIIDSCKFRNIDSPAASFYLKEILSIDLNSVKAVITSHWDDDHISGMGAIVKECQNAKFIMSAAINDKKFTKIVVDSPLSQAIALGQKAKTGITEFNKILTYLKSRSQKPDYALNNKTVWKSTTQVDTDLISLSPDSGVFEKAIQSIISMIKIQDGPVGNIKAPKPNYTSVVLWLRIGKDRLLFGADLEENPEHKGWTLIVEDKTSIDGKAEVYKNAHHGSITGDHEKIWSELLGDSPLCLIAPWKRGDNYLPRESDLKRISSRSNNIHVSSNSEKIAKVGGREKHAQRAMDKINAQYSLSNFSMVRIRKKFTEKDWRYQHYGEAYKYQGIKT